MTRITVDGLRSLFRGGEEFAVIDPREEGLFTRGHLLGAGNIPLSRLDIVIGEAVPHRTTPIVLTDDQTGAADRAEQVLAGLGYSDVVHLGGGIAAWQASGEALFSGINVPGKAFGEYVEHHYRPAPISAQTLKQRRDDGETILLIDTRTPAEHADYCLPGAVLCPNGELALRALDAAASGPAAVVTHCAGRTRSIIGAQTLRDLGVGSPVYALENGTIAWEDAGYELEYGADRPMPVTKASRAAGEKAAHDLRARVDVRSVNVEDVHAWLRDGNRTTYVIDVRGESEYARGHLPGARNVPGGQLIQTIDCTAIVRNARIVLCDDDGIRASVAACWLQRMGLGEIFSATLSSATLSREDLTELSDDAPESGCSMSPEDLTAAMADAETVLLDIRSSVAYRRGHVAGSWFWTREHPARDLANLPAAERAVLIADDPDYAEMAARDLEALGLETRLYRPDAAPGAFAGVPVKTGFSRLASPPHDMHYDSEHLESAQARARENRRYLAWEIALIDDITGDPSVRYT